MDYFTFGAEPEDVGSRIDVFIAENIEELSRSGVQRLIEEGLIKLNGSPVKANYKLREKDIIDVEVPEAKTVEILPENIPLDILYEDKDVIIVNKPQGMVVHPAPGHTSGTLVNALMYHCGDELSGINGEKRPGIVHRIDKDTSGVLMIAKNDVAHQSLAEQLAEHSITRKYNAIVFNGFQEDEGTVDQPIGRNPLDRKKMAVTQKHSRRAVTHYRVLERMGNFTFIEAQLETGRTHQIRVHLTFIGHPLLGDTVYGPKKQPFHLEGQALHARVLGFVHPTTGQYMEFEAPLPENYEKLLMRLKG
ncbi:RluA family pseudouridine synthase [Anaerotignum propionicum]|uniref:Pseudouridine synthase n=1 Tax=Anaerotignum propionicum DSM 1682 TaxID=991789 RepID=A0A110A7N6_ANAPI|nr:RluA family pseudouridine synthase [Anaerotignum propionicum]AMJ41783.1 ribosomal large subunit pseudouridine synthase D [Anaerotignum propionicum DSM 1682]MEA5057430.1 RluA family pseudouridine synthase [Anaerotignum propionicum]SHE84499.1 23S rRNA pseudouridine1911/1915/1917 synthase [[Clostridium] propionicum DSM 1682] [Anaerotignum propionicum DSM 1682]